MLFQDSGAMLNPIRKIGDGFVEYIRTHENMSKKRRLGKGHQNAGADAAIEAADVVFMNSEMSAMAPLSVRGSG